MDNKVNEYLHKLLWELADDCQSVVDRYKYAKRNVYVDEKEEYALEWVEESFELIENALEVFCDAEMIAFGEYQICRYCARQMRREAKGMLRRYIKGEEK